MGDEIVEAGELEFWQTGQANCARLLGLWDLVLYDTQRDLVQLGASVPDDPVNLVGTGAAAGGFSLVWRDADLQDRRLPLIMEALLKQYTDKDDQTAKHNLRPMDYAGELRAFLHAAMQVPRQRSVLETLYLPELATFYAGEGQDDLANFYVARAHSNFLSEWSGLHPLMTSKRRCALQQLQCVIELREYLDFVRAPDNFNTLEPVVSLLAAWENRYPHAYVIFICCDDVIVCLI
jgi:hypothetical protein